jgi:hypothetical protein
MNIEEKISKISKKDSGVHHIFKKILNDKSVFLSMKKLLI